MPVVNKKAKSKKIGITLRHAPYGNTLSQEALDATLAMGLFGQEITLIFLADGVFQLLKLQDTAAIHQKTISKQITALELYDIDQVFVCSDSLAARGITTDSLCIDVTSIRASEIKRILHEQDTLLSF